MIQINAYADPVVVISRNLKALEEALKELDNEAQETELIINQIYIYIYIYIYMRISMKAISIGVTGLKVSSFPYLG